MYVCVCVCVFQFALPVVRWTEKPLFLLWLIAAVGDVFRYDAQDNYQPDLTVRHQSYIVMVTSHMTVTRSIRQLLLPQYPCDY